MVYTITVSNTGGYLSNVSLVDVIVDGNNNNLTLTSGPSLTSSTPGSNATTLQATGFLLTQLLIQYHKQLPIHLQ